MNDEKHGAVLQALRFRAHCFHTGSGVLWHAVNLGHLLGCPAMVHIHARAHLNTLSKSVGRQRVHVRARGPKHGEPCFHGYISRCHSSLCGTMHTFSRGVVQAALSRTLLIRRKSMWFSTANVDSYEDVLLPG